jgi:hypothetical protein
MTKGSRSLLLATLCLCVFLPAKAEIRLLAEGEISATALDQSHLTGLLEDGETPKAQEGGFGGAIAYSGHEHRYYAVPDRGPGAGETSYIERLYVLDIRLNKGDKGFHLVPRITATHLLKDQAGHFLTGDASAFDNVNSETSRRRDSEALRVSPSGTSVFIADEYGPFVEEFDISTGKLMRNVAIPNKFHIDFPSKYLREELNRNLVGRQSNRGLESLAITPEGDRLVAMIQDPLIQDCNHDPDRKLVGNHNRILEINLKSGNVKEYVYPLEDPKNGVSEILAVNDHQFLVLERDSKSGSEAKDKRLHLIDLNGATDVHGYKSLSESGLVEEEAAGAPHPVYVHKRPFLDILQFGIQGIPEKFEGLTFGPLLEDGRLMLILSTDNDFSKTENTRFFAFAIDPAELPDYQPQKFTTAPQPRRHTRPSGH